LTITTFKDSGQEIGRSTTHRLLFITHQRKSILLVDLSYGSAAEIEKTIRALPDIVTTHPLASVLLLSDFSGASFDRAATMAIKETAVFNKRYVKKSAFVGAESFPKEFAEELKIFSHREFPAFKTREEALVWLVKD
jgi:hypothetical protein